MVLSYNKIEIKYSYLKCSLGGSSMVCTLEDHSQGQPVKVNNVNL